MVVLDLTDTEGKQLTLAFNGNSALVLGEAMLRLPVIERDLDAAVETIQKKFRSLNLPGEITADIKDFPGGPSYSIYYSYHNGVQPRKRTLASLQNERSHAATTIQELSSPPENSVTVIQPVAEISDGLRGGETGLHKAYLLPALIGTHSQNFCEKLRDKAIAKLEEIAVELNQSAPSTGTPSPT